MRDEQGKAPGPLEAARAGSVDIDLDLVPTVIADDIRAAVRTAIGAGVVFVTPPEPLSIVRGALGEAIRDIATHPRGELLQRLIEFGPYDDGGPLPSHLHGRTRLTDDELAKAVGFVYSFMAKSLQGALAELLALGPCTALVEDLKRQGRLPSDARLHFADAVAVRKSRGDQLAKGADLHVLVETGSGRVHVCGVAEVKAYPRTRAGLVKQIDRHLARAVRGLVVRGQEYQTGSVVVGTPAGEPPVRIAVTTARWTLPRDVRSSDCEPPFACPVKDNVVRELAPGDWSVTLRSSREALASAALNLTFWFMSQVGRVLYARAPLPWAEMTEEEAGLNAVKVTLYYALLRLRSGSPAEQQAIALYNTYGFGYSLGMNFVDHQGRRAMLWQKDLDEIAATGRTKRRSRIRGSGKAKRHS